MEDIKKRLQYEENDDDLRIGNKDLDDNKNKDDEEEEYEENSYYANT
jgi:hypothetical protein